MSNFIIAGLPHDANTLGSSSSSSTSAANLPFTPYVKAKMDSIIFNSDKICREYRKALYDRTMLGEKMKTDIGSLRTYVIDTFYARCDTKDKIIEPSRKALEFTTEEILRSGRSTAERRAGTSTIGQCKNSIGDKEPIPLVPSKTQLWIDAMKNTKESNAMENWERRHCWLCGLPLKTNLNNNRLGIDCEHKLAMMIMMLVGAGLKKTKPRGSNRNKLITDSNNKKKSILRRFGKGALELHPDWKILVRGEGYAWSHSYCNQYKSQIPFISLKKERNEYEYVIEINNILEFLSGMYELRKNDLEKIFPWYKEKPRKPNSEGWINQYQKAGGMKAQWKKHLGLENFFTKYQGSKQDLVRRAFNNIIDMLIPTYFLLNLGKHDREKGGGIKYDINNKAVEMFQNNTTLKSEGKNVERSFVTTMNEIPIPARLQDNVGRILGWLTKGDETKFTRWLIEDSDAENDNPIRKYLEKPPLLGSTIMKEAHSLKLFKGNSLEPIVEEAEDDNDELQDLVKEQSEVPLVNTSGWIRGLKNPGVKRNMMRKTGYSPDRKKKRGGKKRTRRSRKNKRKRSKRKKKRKRTKKNRRKRKKKTRRRKSK